MISDKTSKSSYGVEERDGGYPVLLLTGPDTTEGRHGPLTKHFGVVYASYNRHDKAVEFVKYYAHKKYGPNVTFCMGVFGGNAIIKNWIARKAKWEDLPDKADFVIVGRFADKNKIYPHKEKIDEAWFRR